MRRVAEARDRLAEQPAQLLDRLRLHVVLSEVDVDELRERQRCSAIRRSPPEPFERPLERRRRIRLRTEPAPLDSPRAATAVAIAVGPERLTITPRPL